MKTYTDLEQSKKLAEILPLESADMYYDGFGRLPQGYAYTLIHPNSFSYDRPCWSLAALLDVLEHPRCFQGDKPIYWFCGCFGKDKQYHEVEADNPVDACYEMIIWLKEKNLF